MDTHSLRVLEFPDVLKVVAGQSHWTPGREHVLALRPLPDEQALRERQAEVAEAIKLTEEGMRLPLGGLEDVAEPIRLAARGGTLDPVYLLQIRELAVTSRKVGRLLSSRSEICPRMSDRSRWLVSFPRLESEIARCLSNDGRVLDTASGRLRDLRSEIRNLEAGIQRSLSNLLRDSEIAKMVQDPLVTQRQGRYVLPVRSEHRGKFPGLVIDQSTSGATVFMEPLSVLHLSNNLRQHRLDEEKEVEAILNQLSGWVAQDSEPLLVAHEELALLDCFFALAGYAMKVGANLPEVGQVPLRLANARHPLLLANGIQAVPISLEVGGDIRTLVMTGPNTGGKTVALKTVGLFTLMALSGMPIPASPGTTIPFVSQVWADIGDEQSIAQSLSTFSAHMTQILRILPNARKNTLVLLDELGAGTDPTEGGALGVALLEALNQAGALTVITTHLSDLKVFASKTPGFQNAAVEFDAGTLSPTFRVVMGVPGRSNALLIASRLGLPDPLLRRARELLGQEHVGVEGLLDDLEHERAAVRATESRMREEEERARELRREYETRMAGALEEKSRILDEAAREAENILAEARAQAHGLLRDFRQKISVLAKKRKEALEQAQHYLAEARDAEPVSKPVAYEELTEEDLERLTDPDAEELDPAHFHSETPAVEPEPEPDDVDESARVAARTVEANLNQMQERLAALKRPTAKPELAAGLAPGSRVYSRRFGQDGELLAIKGEKAEVKLGAVRLTLPLNDLEPSNKPVAGGGVSYASGGRVEAERRIDLRGMTVEEAIFEVDRALDQAALARLEKVEIIHGKGTGALRQGVQKHLKKHPLVEEQRLGETYEGSWGVTIVKLKL